MEKYLPLFYFIAGGASVFLIMMIIGMKSEYEETEKIEDEPKTWSKISNIDYTFDFDYKFTKEMTAQDMVYAMAEVMKNKVAKTPSDFKNTNIAAGSYSITCATSLVFIHRDNIISEEENDSIIQ